ncbi:hypothetical protein B0H10DRAFT_2186638 [Mycena sp. CBHHK59/15]|nr:hypothetical protein B0H10DRAFT_2186638 [Mycena sp. CBHHK59/15]
MLKKKKPSPTFCLLRRPPHMSLFAHIDEWQPPIAQPSSSLTHERTPSHHSNENDNQSWMRGTASTFSSQTQGSQGPQYNRTVLGPSNSFSLPSMATTPAHRHAVSSSFHFLPASPTTDLSGLLPASSSVLGRRKRPDSIVDWSPPTKARLTTYAGEVADEFGVSEGDRDEFLSAALLPTHKLLIVTLAAVLGSRQDASSDTKLQEYLVSAEFKENVINQIRGVLMDPKLPSYKTGFLDRLMHHIRLNPGIYRIPQEFWSMITSKLFQTAVSRAATNARSEMKRKMSFAWSSKMTIYDLVKSMAWKSSQEMTDAIWARFAGVQMQLIDYKENGSKDDGYWDHIDVELAERCAKALTIEAALRPAFSSYIFEEALKRHLQLCRPSKKRKSSQQLPKWQQDISCAVAEMEAYTVEQLASG